jgi:pyridoxamine 5'-phosphate oxidase
MNIPDLRQEYLRATLDEKMAASDPFVQFKRWFKEALAAELPMTNAMTLATVSPTGRPSARTVLLKHLDDQGFVFFTNYESRKGKELAANRAASLLFYWAELERQVRIEGVVEKIPPRESDDYFAQRPLLARHAAIASQQSAVIADRTLLEKRFANTVEQCGGDPPRPAHWGGYRVTPEIIEFWQGRESRLHDRLRYSRIGTHWKIERLAP